MKKSIVLIPLPSLIKNSFVRSFVSLCLVKRKATLNLIKPLTRVSWLGLAVRCLAGKQKDLGLTPHSALLSLQALLSVDAVL